MKEEAKGKAKQTPAKRGPAKQPPVKPSTTRSAGSTRSASGRSTPAKLPSARAAARPPSQKTRPSKPISAPVRPATGKLPEGPAGREAQLEKALKDAREQIRYLSEDRDNQAAIAEAADAERELLQRELTEAKERIRALEDQLAVGVPESLATSSPDLETRDLEIAGGEEEEEEEEIEGAEDFDEMESMYKRIRGPRLRREELDRERMDRESEYGNEPFWMVCPKCGESMEEIETEDLKIDRCESCGAISLDRGELDLLLSLGHGREGLRRIRGALTF